MVRAEKRDIYRKWHKQLKGMSLGQFEKFMTMAISDHVNEAEQAIEDALKEEFGFGNKRLERLKDKAQSIYDERRANNNEQA